MGYGRDKAADAVSDGKDALDALFAEVESLREELEAAERARDEYKEDYVEVSNLLEDAKDEIKRIKAMAFDELAREIAAERMGI